jgi:hypothetical protein
MKTTHALTTATTIATEAAKEDRILDEKGVLTIHPVSGPTLKRQRRHPIDELRFPPPDLQFTENGKNFWFESTVHRYHRQVAEYQRRLRQERAREVGG